VVVAQGVEADTAAGPASIASSLRRTPSCLLSPSPSPSFTSTTTDADTTPTKRETVLLTPPPTSPPVDVEIVIEAPEAESVRAASPPSNAYRALKAALRLSSENRTIVGREEEKAVLQSYLSLVSSRDVGMYISGPPGTGKTALTTAVGRELAAQGWHVAEVGVMGLKANDVWARIADDLGCGRSEEEVTAHLAKSRAFIIIDEVDSLLSSSSHVLSKLFSLPLLSADGTVKLVAISNTLDLTVRANLVLPDGAMPQVLPFRAYNATDMAAIVAARVASAGEDAAKVDSRAVELLCRKVEAQNGDLRMCLGVLSSAVSLAEVEWTKKSDRPQVKVALPHVLKAFASHTQQLKAAAGSSAKGLTSATTTKIRSVPLQGRMVLVSLIVFLARTHAGLAGCPAPGANSETLTASTLYATYAHILSHTSSPFPPSPESDYRDLLSNLETLGLVKVAGSGTTARAQRNAGRVELCIREDEVKAGLGIDAIPTDLESLGMAEQEVLRVWIREDGVVARLRARAAAAIERAVNGLEPPPL
jgi:Cdc6-like AAA superfamily ATPase